MNDRMISILDNYDMTVLRTWKGRGAILCETEKGTRILREYAGPKDKLCVLEAVTKKLQDAGFLTDCLLRNKEGTLYCEDRDRTLYIVKEYREGRECAASDLSECVQAVHRLAQIHQVLRIPDEKEIRPVKIETEPQAGSVEDDTNVINPDNSDNKEELMDLPVEDHEYRFRLFMPEQEYERYNRELKRIWKHLREKSTKTDFEVFLLKYYGFFMEQAAEVLERMKKAKSTEYSVRQAGKGLLCHGDFQHHNILFTQNGMTVINYEKCMQDIQIRDFYLFFRKIMEKNNWNPTVGERLLNGYETVRTLEEKEREQLCLRLAYPEKFRKVVSYYYNSGKAWIPGKNREKLETLLLQEQAKQKVLKELGMV